MKLTLKHAAASLTTCILATLCAPSAFSNTHESNDLSGAFDPQSDDAFLNAAGTASDDTLDNLRGGFAFQGMEINFGADIRTYLNGELAMQTLVSWTPEGQTHSQMVSGALTPASAAQLQASVLNGGSMTMRVGNDQVYLANEGQTALLHRTDGGVQNVLINTASNITATQTVDATLDIRGYDGFGSQIGMDRLGTAIGDAMTAATLGAVGG
jgi:hypothetical protein